MKTSAPSCRHECVLLDKLCTLIRGSSPRPKGDPRYFGGPIPWISIADVTAAKGKYLQRTKEGVTPEGAKRSRLLPAGTLIVSNSATICVPKILAVDGCIHDGFVALTELSPRADIHYLFHYFNAVRDEVRAKNTQGVTQVNLNTTIFKAMEIPLPPLAEQRRIADILDRADAIRADRRAALALLDTLPQAIFLDMFGDPATNPKGWDRKPLTDICHCHSGGTPSKSKAEYWQGRLPWFSAKDLKQDDLFDSADHISEEVTTTTNLKLLPRNTVTIVVRGMILAHTFPVCILRVPATINQDLKALLPKIDLDPQFLANALRAQSPFVLQTVSEAGHGTKRLDTEGLKQIRVPLPPLPLQQEFARRVEKVEQLRLSHREALAKLDELFAGLQYRAFAGEL